MATIKSIEEKARRYDEAIKTARKINSGEGVAAPPDWTICEVIFPELKESENERIRKALIEHFRWNAQQILNDFDNKEVLAWLEKQGEKAKKHDVCDNCDQQGNCVSPCPMKLVEKQGEQKHIPWYDLEKSKEAGYTIVPNEEYDRLTKPAEWSEEDEKHLNRAINILDASKTYTTSPEKYEETINWLKFLKERYTWKPSNEQMNALSVSVKHGQTDDPDALKKLLEQLKKHYL